jgi:hypothetical protein
MSQPQFFAVTEHNGVRPVHPAEPVAQVRLMEGAHRLDLAAEGFDQEARQAGGPVLAALAVADDDGHLVEVNLRDPRP